MRHTFASICISQKVNIKALSQYLGHADINITLDTCGHLLPGDKEEIANTIEAFLAGIIARRFSLSAWRTLGKGLIEQASRWMFSDGSY
jgi:hypothetical protein